MSSPACETVCVSLDQRFWRLPDGSIWTNSPFGLSFWRRYRTVFDRVQCVARVADVERLDGACHRADGDGVSFLAVPCYVGPGEFARRAPAVWRAVRAAARPGSAFVLRVPSALSSLVARRLRAIDYPYAVEVVGDPHDVFAPGSIDHPLRALLRWHGARTLRRQCAEAAAVSYVTEAALQRRYPATGPSIAASSIDLQDTAFAEAPRQPRAPIRELLFVGSLEHHYKAPDVLLAAFARCLGTGLDLRLTLVGGGRCLPELEARARALGVADRVRFAGWVAAGEPVREILDSADLFVLPSRQEGLPRAMLEAMARGLPCVGSSVGGIPELLEPEDTVPPGDAAALAAKILEIARDPARRARMSARNLARARPYGADILRERRTRFYGLIREATGAWLARHRVGAIPSRSVVQF